MLHTSYNQACAHYRSLELHAQIESADPHSLVAMLYDELLLSIDVLALRAQSAEKLAAEKLAAEKLADDPQAHRARAIILSLRTSLNTASGGELAVTLDSLYAALATELEERLAAPEPLRFAELKAGVETLSSAWQTIGR